MNEALELINQELLITIVLTIAGTLLAALRGVKVPIRSSNGSSGLPTPKDIDPETVRQLMQLVPEAAEKKKPESTPAVNEVEQAFRVLVKVVIEEAQKAA